MQFGSEEAVKAGGAQLALLGFLLLPFIWSVPEALVCAELATAFPENSGFVVWVEAAFGPFAGFLEGIFSWLSGVTDNTLYPVMLVSYSKLFFPVLEEWWPQKCVLSSYLLGGKDLFGMNIGIIVVPAAIIAKDARSGCMVNRTIVPHDKAALYQCQLPICPSYF
jgi:amino acid transporter